MAYASRGDGVDHRQHGLALALVRVRPSWASEMTSFTPRSPRRLRQRRKSVQNGPASDGPVATHYYDHDRIQLKLKGLSPVQYRNQA
jgi:hypothetical protein